jgi:hypothetical protein
LWLGLSGSILFKKKLTRISFRSVEIV